MAVLVAGINIGGTRCALAHADAPATILAKRDRSTPSKGIESILNSIQEDIALCLSGVGDGNIKAAGCAAPGMTDPIRGEVLEAANLPGWHAEPLRRLLEERLGVRAAIENDVNAAALAEVSFGRATGSSSAVYITVSTGIAAGIVVEGRLLRGSHHAAGELGSFVPEPHLLDRNWRPNGCLEQLAGGAALGEAWNPGGRPTTSRDVFAAAHASDADALALVRRAADYLAQAVIAVGCILDPDTVILGGSIALRQEFGYQAPKTVAEGITGISAGSDPGLPGSRGPANRRTGIGVRPY